MEHKSRMVRLFLNGIFSTGNHLCFRINLLTEYRRFPELKGDDQVLLQISLIVLGILIL